jgi:fibronectin-binding autotransporter adhesin
MRSERSAGSASTNFGGCNQAGASKRDVRHRRSVVLGAAAIGAVSMLSQRALAANDQWTGATDVNWADSNWTNGNNPPVTGDSLEFGSLDTSGLTLTDNLMTPSTFNVSSITFDVNAVNFIINPATVGTNGFTLTGNIIDSSTSATAVETINDAILLNSTTPTVSIATAGSAVDLGGILSGTNGLTLAGPGTMTLTGANTFTGGLNITAGGIVAGTPQASIPSGNLISLTTGGEFYANTAHAFTNNFSINTGILRAGGATTNTFSGAVNLAGPVTVNTDGGATTVLSGVVSGAGAITATTNGATGTGITTLSGTNTFGGGVTILGSATAASTSTTTLNINGDAALGAVPATPTTNITFAASAGITTTVESLVGSAGLVDLNANRNIAINASSGTANFDPGAGNMMIINGSITDSATAISKTADSGILVWNGANTFATGTTFTFSGTNPSDDGILRLGNSAALGTLPFTINLNEGNQSPALIELTGGITVGNGAGGPGTFAGDVITRVGSQAGDPSLRNLSGNNTYSGIVAVANSGGQMTIESADPNGTLTLGGNISTGAAATTITNRTVLLYGSGNGLISGAITNVAPSGLGVTVANTAGTVGTVVVGGAAASTWTFTGANSYSGSSGAPVLNLAGGTAVLNASLGGSFGPTPTTTANTTNLTLAGGNLSIIGSASSTTQDFGGTLIIGGVGATTAVAGAGVTGGGSNVSINPNGGTTTVTLPNAWTRSAGGTVNFDLSATNGTPVVAVGTVTGTGVLVNGLFGYGTVKDSAGVIGFATTSGTQVVRYTGATTALTAVPATTATSNATDSGTLAISPAGSFALNSLAIDASGGGSLDLGGATDVMTVTSGGLLMTNATASGNFTISDGQVGLAGKELIVQQFGTGTLTISGTVSSGAGSLTKSGPGTLILSGANAYTGVTTINTGVLSVAADANLGSTSGTIAPIIFNGGTLAVTSGFTMSARTITLDPAGGTFDIAPSQTLSIGSTIISPGLAVNGGTGLSAGPLIKTDSGTLALTGTANTYTGGTYINAGTVNIAADGSLGQIPGSLQSPGIPDINIVFTGNSTLQAAATSSLQFNRTVLIDTGVTATLDPEGNTLSVAGAITSQSASGNLAIGAGNAAGTVALTSAVSSYAIPTTVNSGTLNVSFLTNEGAGGGIPSSVGQSGNAAGNLVLATGTTLNYTGTTTSTDRNFTIATGANSSGSVTIGVTNSATTELTMSGAPVGTGTGAGSIGLTKTGVGILAFSGTESYTGATNVNAGTLLVNGSLTSSPLTMLSGATIGGRGTINTLTVPSGGILSPGDPATSNGVGTLTASALTLSSGSVLKLDFGTGSNDVVNVTNSGGLNILGGQLNILSAGTATAFGTPGTYELFSYAGTLTGSVNNFTFGTTSSLDSYVVNNNASLHEVQLVISTATSATWNVNAGGLWDSSASNWSPAGIPNNAGEVVIFGPVVTGGSATISVDGNKTAGGIIFNNTTSSYTIDNAGGTGTGTLILDDGTASASITVNGAPTGLGHQISAPIQLNSNLNLADNVAGTTLTLSGGFTGSTSKTVSLTSGTLQIGSGGTTGNLATGAVTMSSGSTIIFNTTGSNLTLPALIGTGGTLIQNGTNTISLASGGSGGTGITGLQVNNGTVDLHGNSLSLTSFSGYGGGTSPGNFTPGVGIITDNSATTGTTTLTYAGSASTTFSGSINDGATQHIATMLGVSGGGTLTLLGTSTYSGGTTINQGNILVDAATGGLGATNGTTTGLITMNANSQPTRLLVADGVTIANPITFNAINPGVGLGAIQANTTSQTSTFTGPITVLNTSNGSGGFVVGPTAGGNLIFTNTITTPAGVPFIVRSGYVQFSGGGNYEFIGFTGPGNDSLGSSSNTNTGTFAGGTGGIATNAVAELGLNSAAGTLDLNGFNQTLAGITQTTAGSIIESSTGPSVLTVNTLSTPTATQTAYPAATPDTYAGLLTDNSGLMGPFSLVKTGAGTLLLTGTANTYIGGTTIDAGVLGAAVLSSSNIAGSVGFSNLVVNGNSNVTFAGVSGILSYTGASAATNQALVVNSGSIGEFDVATAGTALTWQGELTGSATPTGFIKGGPGTLIIDGPSGTAFTNNYSGNITVSAGTMVVNGTLGTGGAGATLTLASGATLTTTAGQTSGTIAGSLDHTAGSTISIPAASTTLNFSDPLKLDGGSISYAVNSTAITSASPTVTTASQGLTNAAGGLSYGTSGSEQIGLNFSSTNGLPGTFTLNLFDYSAEH